MPTSIRIQRLSRTFRSAHRAWIANEAGVGMAKVVPPAPEGRVGPARPSAPWVVLALVLGLMLSDYMSRQVLNVVFPQLKAAWGLSDTRLGALAGVVGLLVGLLTVPLSVVADAWGRVRSVALMAALWSAATLGCALAGGFTQLFAARFLVGLGEAAYGSVGLAILVGRFPARSRATITALFMGAGPVGSVLGLALGGAIAKAAGWRSAFAVMAALGFALAAAFWLSVREEEPGPEPARVAAPMVHAGWTDLRGLLGSPVLRLAYVGSGLQLFTLSALIAWLPSHLHRSYAWPPDRASLAAAALVLASALGMVIWGAASDRLSRRAPARAWAAAGAAAAVSAVLLGASFTLPPGSGQLALLAAGLPLTAGASGPTGAIVAGLTPRRLHATAFATVTLLNNLLGIGPGPFLTGVLADAWGLERALSVVPVAGIVSAAFYLAGGLSAARAAPQEVSWR